MSNVINMSGGAADLQSKTVNPSTSQQVVRPDTGKDGLSQVTVNAMKLQSNKVIGATNQIQTIKPDSGYDGFSQITVDKMSLQEKTIYPSWNTQHIYPDGAYYGFSGVTVEKILKAYAYIVIPFTGNGSKTMTIENIPLEFGIGTSDYVHLPTVRCAVVSATQVSADGLVFSTLVNDTTGTFGIYIPAYTIMLDNGQIAQAQAGVSAVVTAYAPSGYVEKYNLELNTTGAFTFFASGISYYATLFVKNGNDSTNSG